MPKPIAKPKSTMAVMLRLQNGEIELYQHWREKLAKRGEGFKAGFVRLLKTDL